MPADPHARLEALHEVLVERVTTLVSSQDWLAFLTQSRRFHTYSPTNQSLLAAQLLDRAMDLDGGYVASYTTWARQPASDGGTCQVRRGERALWVYAPVTARTIDDETGERQTVVRGFKPVAVFHQSQLATPPALATQPSPELLGGDGHREVEGAVIADLGDVGFAVRFVAREPGVTWNGQTDFGDSTVRIADDLAPAQRLKTLAHEWAHVHLGHAGSIWGPQRRVVEVEAESVAYLTMGAVGIDSASYTIPYVAAWAGTDPVDTIRATSQRVLGATGALIGRLEDRLHITIEPDPLQRVPAGADTSVEREANAPDVASDERAAAPVGRCR